MRALLGVGLVAVVGLAACVVEKKETTRHAASSPGNDDGTSTDTDPTDPGNDPSTGADPAEDPPPPPSAVLSGISVTDVAVFQAVKIPIVSDGAAVTKRNAPVVANRDALVRVYVKPGAGWRSRQVTAELHLMNGKKSLPVVKETKQISDTSTDEDLSSTFNLEVPAGSLPEGVTYQVVLTGSGAKIVNGDSDGRFPSDASYAPMNTETSGKVKIVVVPVQYDADGSGRTPDVSTTQLERYRKRLMALYPATDIEITTHAPMPWSTEISRTGDGFDTVLDAVTQLRGSDLAPPDVYYYGALAPASSMTSFCKNACVAGLSTVVSSATVAMFRASVGLGFSGDDATETMAHEVGHAHGREHAPCGNPASPDADFPYDGGVVGVWGYDMNAKTLIAPTTGTDMMGYCESPWISDYTYAALFKRIASVNVSNAVAAPQGSGNGSAYRVARVRGDGTLTWSRSVNTEGPLTGGIRREATYLAASGAMVSKADAHFYPYDHLPGGVLLVPAQTATPWASVRVSGHTTALTR